MWILAALTPSQAGTAVSAWLPQGALLKKTLRKSGKARPPTSDARCRGRFLSDFYLNYG